MLKGRIDSERVLRFTHQLADFSIHIEAPFKPADWEPVVGLATEHRLTIYDAAYLELAHRTGLPLATLDSALRRAARNRNVALLGV